MIDTYLADLREQLRVPSDRILAEVEDHLREAAERHGEPAAVARFGPPELVAARFHRGIADRDARRSLRAIVLTGVVLFGLFLAVDILEPRAPWPDQIMPLGLEWKLHVAMLAGQVALAAGVISAVHYFLGRRLVAIRAATAALGAAAVALGFHLAFQVDRLSRVHHTSSFAALVLATAAVRIAALAVAGSFVVRAARRVGRFERPSGNGLLPHAWIWCAAFALLAGISVFAHDEATRTRSIVDGGIEAATVVAAFALLSRPLALASGAAYKTRRIPQ